MQGVRKVPGRSSRLARRISMLVHRNHCLWVDPSCPSRTVQRADDIVQLDIFCGQSLGAIESPTFDAPIIQSMDEGVSYIMLMKHFPILQLLMNHCPPWMSKLLSPKANGMVDFRNVTYPMRHPAFVC